MGENLEILKNELEKANDIVSNINRKVMTEFIQYLIAKSFYINPDKSEYSSYPYHPDELVEPLVGDSVAINVPQRSKKWVAFENMTLLNNWSTFLADQPPQFKRLSAILLKKPCSYNILTDTLSYNDTGKGNNSSLCGTIKLKQLIIDYNRMTKLYARLGKGICRCLNSCYYRAKLLLVGSSNPQVTGPFSEPEAQLCYNLYKSLQLNPNHTLDYVCEQIGKSLNRPPQLIALFLETLEQIKGNSIPKIPCSPPKNTTNTLNSVSNATLSVPFASKSFNNPMACPIPNEPLPISEPVVGPEIQVVDLEAPTFLPSLNLVELDTVGPGNPYESLKCKTAFTHGIKCSRWPAKVNDVLVQVIKWHYNHKLDFDFEALAQQVEPLVLRSIICCLHVDWISIVRTLIKSCTDLPPCHLDPCVEIFGQYWTHKLRRLLFVNLTNKKKVINAQPVYYERAYLNSFFAKLRVFVALKKPEKVAHALLITAMLRSKGTPESPMDWHKVTRLYNAASNDTAHMPEEQLKKMFDDMKQTYLPLHGNMNEKRMIKVLHFIITGNLLKKSKNQGKYECFPKAKVRGSERLANYCDEQNDSTFVEIKDENEIVGKQEPVDNAYISKHSQNDSQSSTPKRKMKQGEEEVCRAKERSHLSEILRHKEIESEAMPLEPETLLKIKKEVDNSDGGKIARAYYESDTKLREKDKMIFKENCIPKPKSESLKSYNQLNESLTDQELSDMGPPSVVKNFRKIEKIIRKNRTSLKPEQLRIYESSLVSSYDEGILDRIKTDPTSKSCKQEHNINTHSEAKEQHGVDDNIPVKVKKRKKLKDIKAENIELEDKVLELHDSMPVKKKHKNITDSTVKSQIVENKLKVCDRKSLKQKSSKFKTPEIIEFADIKSDCIIERCKDEEIINELSETPSKKTVKSKKREAKDFPTEKKKSRKKEKIEAQELNRDDNQKEVKSETKEITICKKLEFESTGFIHEELTKHATKKLKKSKKASISEVDNQETSLNLEPSSPKKKHKVKVVHNVNDENKDVLIKVKKSKVKKAESLHNVDAPMFNLDVDQDESNVFVISKPKKKERTLIDNPNNESVVELPRKKKSKKIVEMNDDCQETTTKIKKRDKKVKASLETTEQKSSSPKDLKPFQEVLKTSPKSSKGKFESDSQKRVEPSAFTKTENNVSEDEPIQILSPPKINVTRDNAKKHLVITIEDSDDICEMKDDCRQTIGADKFKSIESIKLQKLIEALGNNPNNQYRIINEIRKAVKLRST